MKPEQFQTPLRNKIRSWSQKNPKIHKFSKSLFNTYCKLIGPMHVLPNFIIIGAAKSGTSSLYEYLIQHPSIYKCLVKEPNYFANYFHKNIDWYRSFFPSTLTKFYVEKTLKNKFSTGEASTQYYWYPHTAERVKQLLPNVKLIVLLRNPIERSFSHYQMEVRNGNEKLSFEEAIKKEKERTQGEYEKILSDKLYFSPKYTMQAYIEKSIYINSIKRWTKYFPLEQFLFVKAEDFYENTTKELNKILKFLDLSEFELKKYDVLRKGSYSKLNSQTREELCEFFKPYNEELYRHIGINFNWDE